MYMTSLSSTHQETDVIKYATIHICTICHNSNIQYHPLEIIISYVQMLFLFIYDTSNVIRANCACEGSQ